LILQKEKIYVPLTEGVETRTDERFIQGKVTLLENGVYRKKGRIDKRYGFTNYTTDIFGGGSLSAAKGIYSYKNELLCESNGVLYSYSSALAKWISKGTMIRTSVETQTVIRNNSGQRDLNFATISNIRVYAWRDDDGTGMRYSVQDTSTGAYFVYNALLDAATGQPKIITSGSTFYVVYQDGSTTIKYRTISTSTPSTLSSESDLVTDLSTTRGFFDVVAVGSDIFLCYVPTGLTIKTIKYNTSMVQQDSDTFTPADIDGFLSLKASTVSGTTNLHYAWYQTTGSQLHVRIIRASDLDQVLADTAFTNGTLPGVITGVQISTSSHNVQWFLSGTFSSTTNSNLLYKGVMGTSGIVTDMVTATRRRGFLIATEAFRVNNAAYLGVAIVKDDQSALFVIDSNYNIIAKISPGEAGNTQNNYPWTAEVSGNVAYLAYNRKGEYNHEGNTFQTLLGYSIAAVDFGISTQASTAVINNNLYIASGALQVYDGVGSVEENFTYYPTILAVAPTISPGDLPDGDYQYCATYEWLDNQGNLHRSAPSAPVTATMTGGPASMGIEVDYLNLTNKEGTGRAEVKQVLYRTEEGPGSVFYRVDSFDNDTSASGNTILDGDADSAIIDNEILYTQGGILENIQAPTCDIVVAHGKRLVIGGLEDGTIVRVSKPIEDKVGIGFNEALEIKVPPQGGRVLDIFSMDEKLVFMKAGAIYWSSGDGPDRIGAGSFSDPQVLTDLVGIKNKNAGISTPIGIIFQSSKGFCLLDRSMALDTSFGDAVYDYKDYTVHSVVSIPNQDEVRFCTTDGPIIVYNYRENKWSVFPDMESVGSCIFDDKHVIVTSAGVAKYEDFTTFYDNGSTFIEMKARTGWIQVDDIEGLQRIWRMIVVGEYNSAHKLRVDVSYDYDATTEIHRISLSSAPTSYGYEVRHKRQKCSAIRYTISDEELDTPSGSGQGVSLSGLRLICGVKSKLSNQPATRKF
jgi:hypothetical protein